MFPELLFDDIDDVGGWGGDRTRWTGPYAINATLTKLMGTHNLKAGADVRQLGIKATTETSPNTGALALAGSFSFDRLFTSRNGVGGHEFASLLLGLPRRRLGALQPRRGRVVHALLRRLRPGRLAGELEVHAQLRRAARARGRVARSREPADGGLRSRRRRTRSTRWCRRPAPRWRAARFAAASSSPASTARPNSRATHQRSKWRRASVPPTRSTPTRCCAAATARSTRRGSTTPPTTARSASRAPRRSSSRRPRAIVPITTLDNPFPGGLQQPIGSSLGLLTGVGGDINFIDQNKGAPIVHQVLVRPPARARRRHGADDRLHGGDRARSRVRRHQQRGPQYQPD